MAVERNLISGSLAMLVLKLLSERDMYGYEMIETLRARSQNVFELKAGTLYPLLHGYYKAGEWTFGKEEERVEGIRRCRFTGVGDGGVGDGRIY